MTLCLSLIANQRVRDSGQIAVPGGDAFNHGGNVWRKRLQKRLVRFFQTPGAGDHYFALWQPPYRIFQDG